MPELPEVETIKNYLKESILGKSFLNIKTYRKNLRYDFCDMSSIENKEIKRLYRRAKYIVVEFFSIDKVLLIHLGMTGKFYLSSHRDGLLKHTHASFQIASDCFLNYCDVRRFGFLLLMTEKQLKERFSKLSPEPLSIEINEEFLYQILKTKKINIKQALMSQDIAAGMGNIYVCEVLFKSKIHPKRKVHTLTKRQCLSLC